MAELKVQVQVVKKDALADIQSIQNRLNEIEKNPVQIKFQVTGLDGTAQKMEQMANAQNRVASSATSATTASASFASSQRAVVSAATQGAQSVNTLESAYNRLGVTVANFAKYKVFEAVTSGIRDSVQEMRKLDDELVTVRKVTDATQKELDQITQKSYEVGSKYGKAPSAYAAGVAEFARAGYRETADELAELSIKSQLVGDMSATVANQFLLATDAAYGYKGSIDELSAVLDGMNAIDNNFATSIAKMSTGLGKVAPIAAQAHVGVDELSAAIGTITAVTQRSGEEAATALRALFLNIMGDTKTEIEDGAKWTAGEIDGLRDILERYAPAAVAAAEATGQVINPMEAMRGLAQSMREGVLSEQELMQMVTDIGGKLRSSQLLAIVQNWDVYESMLSTYQNAAGSADKEISKMMDGWSFKAEQLRTSFTKMLSGLADSKDAKNALDLLRGVVEALDSDFGRAAISAAVLGTAMSGVASIAKRALSMFGMSSTISSGWIGLAVAGVSLLASGLSELMPNYEKLADRAQEAQNAYEAEKTKLGNIKTELDGIAEQIDALKGKGTLTFVEATQLENLLAAEASLEKQYEIQKKIVAESLRESAYATVTAGQKRGVFSTDFVENNKNMFKNYLDMYTVHGSVAEFPISDDINETVAALEALKEARQDALDAGNDVSSFNQAIQSVEGTLLSMYTNILEEQQQLTPYLKAIKDLPVADLTTQDKAARQQFLTNQDNIQVIQKLIDEEQYYLDIQNELMSRAQELGGVTKDTLLEAAKAYQYESSASVQRAIDIDTVRGALASQLETTGDLASAEQALALANEQASESNQANEKTYASLQSTIDATIAQYNLLHRAIRETNATGLISADTFKELEKLGLDLGQVFEDDTTGGFKVAGDTLESLLNDTEAFLNELTGAELEFDTEGLSAFDQLLKEAQNDVDELKKRLSEMGESGDLFRDYQDIYSDATELLASGRTNTNAFAAYINELFNDDVIADIGNSAEKAGKYLNDSLIKGMLDPDKTGEELAEFMAKNYKGAGATFTDLGDSIQTVITDWEAFSESTGLSIEVLQGLFGYMAEWDNKVKELSDTSKDAEKSNKKAAKSFDEIQKSATKAGKIKFSDYVKEAKKANKSTEEIQKGWADLEKSASKKGIELEMDVDDAESAIEEISQKVDDETEKDNQITFETNKQDVIAAIDEIIAKAQEAYGPWPVVFDVVVNGEIPGGAQASGTDNAPGGPTLVNELGPEIIVSRGRAFIAGDGRPTIVDLEPGDIVYNHLETQAIQNGRTMPADGIDSFASGTSKLVSNAIGAISSFQSVTGSQTITTNKPNKKTGGGSSGGSSSGGGGNSRPAREEEPPDWWSIVQDWFGYYTDKNQRAIDRIAYQIELLENGLEDVTAPLEKQIDQIERLNDQIDRQVELLERQQESMVKPIQDEIEALEKAKDIQDEQLELAEKQKAVEEARNELQNAQNERTIRYFNEQKGQWEWMADKGAVADAQQALEDAEKDLADYEYDMHIRELERQIEQIEDVYEAKIGELEEQQTANDDLIYDLEQQILAAEDAYNAAIEPLEQKMTELERQLKAIEEAWAEAEIPYEVPEDDLNSALANIGGTAAEKEAVQKLIEQIQKVSAENFASIAQATDQTVSIAPTTTTQQQSNELFAEMGLLFGGSFGTQDAAAYQTSNVNTVYDYSGAVSVGSITIEGNPDEMTLSDLVEEVGIYVQR